jgi:hypothetical protein
MRLCADEFISWPSCAKCAEQHVRDLDLDNLIAGDHVANKCTGFDIDSFCQSHESAGPFERKRASGVMVNLLDVPHTHTSAWAEGLQEKELGKSLSHLLRVDIEMPGMLTSTFDGEMQLLLHASFCSALHVPASSVESTRITEWDLSVVVQYQMSVVSSPAVERLFHNIESKSFVARVVENLVEMHPQNAGRLQEMFSNMKISRPMILSSHDHAEGLGFVHYLASIENIFVWCFVGSACGVWMMARPRRAPIHRYQTDFS